MKNIKTIFKSRYIGVFLFITYLFICCITSAKALTFTPGMAARDAPGPFSTAPVIQGDWDGASVYDYVSTPGDGWVNRVADDWELYVDGSQGSIVFWITPEWNGNDNLKHIFTAISWNAGVIYKETDNKLYLNLGWSDYISVDVSSWTAGTTYLVVARWDRTNKLDGSNHLCLSIDNVHSCGVTSIVGLPSGGNIYIGNSATSQNWNNPAQAIIEGLTVYRRPLFDGSAGIDVGNGDEIAKIYDSDENNGNGLTPQDPTLVTGSWDVTFALPTNSATGNFSTTGNAWMHPFKSNLLYTSTTNTGGFMANGAFASDGWNATGYLNAQNSTGGSIKTDGDDFVRIPYSASLDLSSNFTIMFWWKPTSTWDVNDTTYMNGIVTKSSSTSDADNDWGFFLSSSDGGKMRMGTYGERIYTNTNSWLEGVWYHIALSYTDSDNATIYVNGIADNNGGDYIAGSVDGVADNPIEIGKGFSSYGSGYYDTTVDDLRIYNRVLEQQEIVDTMHKSTLSSLESSGLSGRWIFSEGSGQTIGDSSGSGNTATLGADSNTGSDDPTWSTSSSAPSVLSLSDNEKIFLGGYKFTSSASNQGIYYDKTVTGGNDFVVRALAHSDGTCVPRVTLYDQTGGVEIGHLDGTASNDRDTPAILLFTGEVPGSGSKTLRVKLTNTASSGTCYWHQVELLSNLVNNPSLETGSGNPWIPSGYVNDGLSTDEGVQETTIVHSGSSSFKLAGNANNENIRGGVSDRDQPAKYYMTGVWSYEVSGDLQFWIGDLLYQNQPFTGGAQIYRSINGAVWNKYFHIGREINIAANFLYLIGHSATGYFDDVFQFQLTDVPLTITPANLANSTENTDEIRVDGRDTYVDSSVSDIHPSYGSVSFSYRPRHSAGDIVKFAENSSEDAYVVNLFGDGNDYIKVYWDSANTLKAEYSMAGVSASGTWDATGAVNANSEYTVVLSYIGGGNFVLKIGGSDRIILSSIPSAFGTTPNNIYFGSDSDGGNQGDATFSDITYPALFPTATLNVLTPDPVTNTLTPILTGTASSTNANISDVEFQLDQTSGLWTNCIASDGIFDEPTEEFSCTLTANINNGSHTMYVRAMDDNNILTESTDYGSDTFTISHTCTQTGGSWTQCDWAGGSGQTNWSDDSKYLSGQDIVVESSQPKMITPNNWYSQGWMYRKQIIFNNSGQDENLIDFPVLIKLDSGRIDYSKTQNSGQDIRFTDSNGSTLLDHEIEIWDESGSSYVWVSVPQIDASSSSDYIYIYYGNQNASDGQNAAGVWNLGFAGVWHFSDAGPSSVLDSTGNNNNGTQGNGVDFQIGSIMGKGLYFNESSNEYITIPDSPSLDITSQLTLEAWVKPHFDETDAWARGVIDKSNVNVNAYKFLFHYDNDGYRFRLPGYTNCNPSGTPWDIDTWHYITGSYMGGVTPIMKNYFDSVLKNTCSTSVNSITNTDKPLLIGDADGVFGDEKTFNGMIDEVRISNVQRSLNWIKASYATGTDNYVSYGTEQAEFASFGTLTSSVYDTGQGSNWGVLDYIKDGYGTIEVRLKSSNNSDMSGSPDFNFCDVISDGNDISGNNCIDDNNRYIQYQIKLIPFNGYSPTFIQFSIPYEVSDNQAPLITLNPLSPDPNNDDTPTISGNALESVGTITNIEYRIDSGSWNVCTALDGTFDEYTEEFSCTMDSLTDGTHTVYIRATDSNSNTTDDNNLTSDIFEIDTAYPLALDLNSPGDQEPVNNTRPTFKWKTTTDSGSGISGYKFQVNNGDSGGFTIDNISGTGSKTETNKYIIEYQGLNDDNTENNYITLQTKSSSEWGGAENDGAIKEGKRSFRITVSDNVGNELSSERVFNEDLTSPTFSDVEVSGNKSVFKIHGKVRDAKRGSNANSGDYIRSNPRFLNIDLIKENTFNSKIVSSAIIDLTTTCDYSNTEWDIQECEFYQEIKGSYLTGKYKVKIQGIDWAGNTGIYEKNIRVGGIQDLNTGVKKSIEKVPGYNVRQDEDAMQANGVGQETFETDSLSDALIYVFNSIKTRSVLTVNKVLDTPRYLYNLAKTPSLTLSQTAKEFGTNMSDAIDRVELAMLIVLNGKTTEISEIKITDITKDSAIIVWKTNHPTYGKLNYGTTTSFELGSQSDDKVSEDHSVRIENLPENKMIYFEVISQGTTTVYDAYHTFKTLGQ